MSASQVLTAQQMRTAEQMILDTGMRVGELMEIAARGAAGYVKRLGSDLCEATPAGLVCDPSPLDATLEDSRLKAVLVGPGLGRDEAARKKLIASCVAKKPLVLDADALHLLRPDDLAKDTLAIATPHDGELDALCRSFAIFEKDRMTKAKALALASGMVILAKGPDSFVASPKGMLAIGPAASSWLSVTGSGDVLAGLVVSRLATGEAPFDAACQALWLHSEAARLCSPPFTADDLAARVSDAFRACL